MHFSKNEYKETMKTFLEDHHGQIIKLRDANDEIFSYIIRCESTPGNKNLISFGVVFDVLYLNPTKNKMKINAKELKFYGVKRVMEKWKNIEDDQYVKYPLCFSDEIKNNMILDLTFIKQIYSTSSLNREFDVNETAEYIFKTLKGIEKYYKNEEYDKFMIAFV